MEDNHFLAEVRNINDPWFCGRVQIRIYGLHDDETNIKDVDLPWATPIQDITSAATAKAGKAPLGMLVGSRVFGIFLDKERQMPIILGTYARAAKPVDKNDNTQGQEGSDPTSKGVDLPASTNPSQSDNIGRAPNHPVLNGKALNTENDMYNKAQFSDNGSGDKAVDTAKQKFAPNSEQPTTAAADTTSKLPESIAQVDPAMTSQILTTMFSSLASVRDIMNLTTANSQNKIVTDSFSFALALLVKKYGFTTIINIFSATLNNNNILYLNTANQKIVKDGLNSIILQAAQLGPTSIPVYIAPDVIFPNNNQMTPAPLYTQAPDLYIQKYYAGGSDPNPGYIEWIGPNNDSVYTLRTNNNPPYSSATESLIATTQSQIAMALEPNIITGSLSIITLNNILETNNNNVNSASNNAALGVNSLNILNIIQQLIGVLGQTIATTQSAHLPQSVLNVNSVNTSLQNFAKNMAIIKKKKDLSTGAFDITNIIPAVTSIVQKFTTSGLTSTNISTLSNLIISINGK